MMMSHEDAHSKHYRDLIIMETASAMKVRKTNITKAITGFLTDCIIFVILLFCREESTSHAQLYKEFTR